ncbi:DUF4333 domain-containing protein [Nocardiopsis sp. L17-MgMaSL7]|uniref:DUF4333 domain-containing protein n=1 Tax=Nocardiopsis sp. L17-MgMaSL7 TaxID=1938893 RepID=UPI000D91AA62|nr:DUF4333 domain-containing protein [Nocardiopsis sp. L17-MgMaSL7]PWV50130.1 uncharacterized protein DUF4333 [Nocardiopsis sp. L17-MgMaSL7]
MRRVGRSGIVFGTALGVLLLVTACSFEFSIGGGDAEGAEEASQAPAASVDVEEVENQSSARLSEQVGQVPDDFTCPGNLPAEEGAQMRCELTAGGQSLGVTLTVTSVDGGQVDWDIVVDG